jgi:outer membrane protein assembly factor BamB
MEPARVIRVCRRCNSSNRAEGTGELENMTRLWPPGTAGVRVPSIQSLILQRCLALVIAIAVTGVLLGGGPGGCSGGGGGSSSTVPTLPWDRFRANTSGSGVSNGDISTNPGGVLFSVSLPGGATISSPVIGSDDTIYLGTGDGLLAVSSDGAESRLFAGYTTGTCTRCTPPTETCQLVGPISSTPAVTLNGDLVAHTEAGRILALHDDGSELTCLWISEGTGEDDVAGAQSSPLIIVDPTDGSLSAIYVGTATGHLLALNGDGSEKWRVVPSGVAGTPITASPAISSSGILYITTSDGFLNTFSPTGQRRWRFAAVQPSDVTALYPSPAVSVAAYAVSPNGGLTAVNPDGTLSWRFELGAPIPGSAAFMSQSVEIEPTVTPTPASTPLETPAASPTPTYTPETTIDTIVYVVDVDGALYGIRDSTGRLAGKVLTGAAGVSTSPAVAAQVATTTESSFPFVVFGAADGFLYATTLSGEQPCADCDEVRWESIAGAGARLPVGAPVMSSPVIGDDGTIYITTAAGRLLAIGATPNVVVRTHTPTPTPTATPTPT